VNISSQDSDLRIQLQTDPRYQEFIAHAETRGSGLQDESGQSGGCSAWEDLGVYADKERRRSKRQKDLADIFEL
jgi:hypothetical protein